jgi:hypothetical protein
MISLQNYLGIKFTDEGYIACYQQRNCNNDLANYLSMINTYQACEKRNLKQIDELWLFDGPWFGHYEAIMAGPNALNTNGPPITNSTCARQMHIMVFNQERGVAEMLENMGHRFEGVMRHVFGEDPRFSPYPHATPWGKFAMWNQVFTRKRWSGMDAFYSKFD